MLRTRPWTLLNILGMLIPLIRDQVSQIRALGFPTADADMLAAVFDDLDAILDRAEADPSVMMMDSTALFADVNARLAAYGLDVCSQIVG